ncbi:malonyl-ACP O-methyltransferase BioC [Lutibacter sp. B2]|nr:malonyl-ACP O-methyltransferase BioC [Lutibacter sp. B2]
MINKDKVKRRFSRNAKQYDNYAMVQKSMGDILIENIKGNHFKNILEIGCGTGYVTRALMENFEDAKITAVDIAAGMIEQTKSTIKSEQVEFICGDIEEITLNDTYDLIISNATFQWFNHLDATIYKLRKMINKDGILCFSIFGKDTFRELHEAFRKAKDLFNIKEDISASQSFYSLDQLKDRVNNIGENMNVNLSEEYETEYFQSCKDFLYAVKKIGANHSGRNRNKTNPDFIQKVMDIYDYEHLENNKVRATYHNIFVYMKQE